jgi:hypothetical protein
MLVNTPSRSACLDGGREEHLQTVNLWVSLNAHPSQQTAKKPRPTIRALAPKEWAGMLDENLALTTPEFP